MLFLQFKRLLWVLSLSQKLWPVKDEFLKFAADIFAKLSMREYLNVIHVTVEKQPCLGYVAILVNSATVLYPIVRLKHLISDSTVSM